MVKRVPRWTVKRVPRWTDTWSKGYLGGQIHGQNGTCT